MSRFLIEKDAETTVFVGADHVFGYFAQVYTNGTHDASCECAQCEYDQPAAELDNAESRALLNAWVITTADVEIPGRIYAELG